MQLFGFPGSPAPPLRWGLAILLLATPLGAQERVAGADGPLYKSDLVRLLALSRGPQEPIVALVHERCVAFEPTAKDRKDLEALGASADLMAAVQGCRAPSRRSNAAPDRQGPSSSLASAPLALAPEPITPITLAAPDVNPDVIPVSAGTKLPGPATIDRPPRLTNAAEVARLIQERYPPELRRTGVGGTVVLKVLVSVRGEVAEAEIAEPGPDPRLDAAALELAPSLRFEPARLRATPISAWTRQPISFRAP